MSQSNVDFSDNPTGSQLLDDYLAREQENNLTSNSGIKRPSYAIAGTKWLDTSSEPWVLKMFTGSNDVVIGYIDKNKGTFKPDNALPDLEGQAGKYLTNNGEVGQWVELDALPEQSGQGGKYLTTNGSEASWETVDVEGAIDEKFNVGNELPAPSNIKEGDFYYILGSGTSDESSSSSIIPDYVNFVDIADNTYNVVKDGWIWWSGSTSGGSVSVNGVTVGQAGNYTDQPFAQFLVGVGDVVTCNNKTYFRFIPFR